MNYSLIERGLQLDDMVKGKRYGGSNNIAIDLQTKVSSDYTLSDPIYSTIRNNRLTVGPSITTGPRFVWPDVGNALVVGVEGAGHHLLETMGNAYRNCSRVFSNHGHPGIVLGKSAF